MVLRNSSTCCAPPGVIYELDLCLESSLTATMCSATTNGGKSCGGACLCAYPWYAGVRPAPAAHGDPAMSLRRLVRS